MSLANLLVYNGQLRCGAASVATARLVLPQLAAVSAMLRQRLVAAPAGGSSSPSAPRPTHVAPGPVRSCWVSDLLDPERTVVFVNTDALPARDTRPPSGAAGTDIDAPLSNPLEGRILVQVLSSASLLAVHCWSLILCMQLLRAMVLAGVPPAEIGVISPYRAQLRLLKQLLRDRLAT
jgi:hypothetical protein